MMNALKAVPDNAARPSHMTLVNTKKIATENDLDRFEIAKKYESEIEVRFTQDPNVLSQYYMLREKCFRKTDEDYRKRCPQDCIYWVDYDGSENVDDKNGKILVALHEGKVVGGMRFLLCDWIDYTLNEVPEAKFTHREFLKTVKLDPEARYAEIEDILIDKSFRDTDLTDKMFSALIDESKRYNCKYLVGVAVKVSCRNIKRIFHRLGYRLDIFFEYSWLKQKNHGFETRYPVVAFVDSKI